MSRLRLALATLVACVAAAALALLIAAGHRDGTDSAARTRAGEFAGALRPPGIPPQDFSLEDQDGERVSLADHRGEVVVLTFLYSTCEDTCPLTAQQIRGALDQLGHDVPALAVSVDPANDTPRRAQRFLLQQKLTRRMRFLLGSRAELEPIWKAYGIRPQGEGFEHSAYVLLIDRRGRQRIGFPVDQLTPEGLAHDIRMLEAEAA
ncbi:MAG: SCO family protein [Solirubrobacteraceae bacterium]|nr:SCO family protein [Solirubrobacteraceae bacterium]